MWRWCIPASIRVYHPSEWLRRSEVDVLSGRYSSNKNCRQLSEKLLKSPLTSGSELSTKASSNSIASHTLMRARLRFLKSTLALMLKAMVCFSAFNKISSDTYRKQKILTVLLRVECLDAVTGSVIVSKLGLVCLLVEHWLVVPHPPFEDIDWGRSQRQHDLNGKLDWPSSMASEVASSSKVEVEDILIEWPGERRNLVQRRTWLAFYILTDKPIKRREQYLYEHRSRSNLNI